MKSIRRSGAYDLPPNADTVISSITVVSKPAPLPSIGDIVTVKSYCGLHLVVKLTEIEIDETGWRALAMEVVNRDAELRALGVFIPQVPTHMRIFDSQVISS
jgi:hypothetical protein